MRKGLLIAWVVLGATRAAFPGEGLYVWEEALLMTNGRPDDGIGDAEAQERLLRLCREGPLDVRRLYVLAEPSSWDRASLRSFLAAARARGIDAYAVPAGALQDTWVRPFRLLRRCDHDAVLEWLQAILDFDAGGGEARFAGVQLDIEPHGARSRDLLLRHRPVWRSGQGGLRGDRRNRRLAREYLRLLDRVRERLTTSAPRHALAVTLPTWFDRDDDAESFNLEVEGIEKAFIHHVQDRVDFVTLMNYLDGSDPAGLAASHESIAGEVRYGPAESLFETSAPDPLGRSLRPWETVYEEGERRLFELVRRLGTEFEGQPNFLGSAAHHYLRSYGGGAAGWPTHDQERAAGEPRTGQAQGP